MFQMNRDGFRVVAFVSGNGLHISEVYATNPNESTVRFLGFIDNGEQDCPESEIVVKKVTPGAMWVKVTPKVVSEQGLFYLHFSFRKWMPFPNFHNQIL